MELNNIEEAIDKFQFKIFKYCYQMVRSKETAEDITQEVFIKFFNISKKKEYTNSYLYKIAHNKCIDHLRREKRRKLSLIKYPCKTKEVSTEDLASKDKYSREIEEALTILTSYEKSVLLLKSVNGFSYKEISNILNKKEPALRKQFERARKKAEKMLSKKKEEYDNGEVSVF